MTATIQVAPKPIFGTTRSSRALSDCDINVNAGASSVARASLCDVRNAGATVGGRDISTYLDL